jgi:hypothetical protein
MNEYSRYSSCEDQQIEAPVQTKSQVKEITEQSTPHEMANFITMKLMEVIEQELNSSKKIVASTQE